MAKDGTGGLRIIDILQESDHSDDTSHDSSKSSSSFKSAVSHWLAWMKNRREEEKKQKHSSSNECPGRQGRGLGCFKSVWNGKTVAAANSNSEQQIQIQMGNGTEFDKPIFHIGVGVGLIYLLAKTSHDFKRMTELRKQMEIVVKETRESFAQTKHGNGNAAADIMESTHFSDSSSDKISYNNVSFRACDGMLLDENNDHTQHVLHKNQLEDELRSELLQLRHNLDIAKRVEVLDSDYITESDNDCDAYVEEEEENEENEEEDDGEEEHYNDMEAEWGQNNGVCPYELERRLHELLEERQQHQIIELQFALDNTERELQQIEREIYWLKNATSLLRSGSTKSC